MQRGWKTGASPEGRGPEPEDRSHRVDQPPYFSECPKSSLVLNSRTNFSCWNGATSFGKANPSDLPF